MPLFYSNELLGRNVTVKTFDGNSFECNKINKSQKLSLLSSRQINITGYYWVMSIMSKKILSITIKTIFDVSDPEYAYERTFSLISTSKLDYDM